MRRCTALIASGLVASTVACLGAGRAAAQQANFDDVVIQARHVAGSVYYLEGQGGNIGVSVGEDGVVMIDDQFAPLTDRIVSAIREISDAEIRFVINTHVHGDHTGGNENLGRMGVEILARDEVRVRLAEQAPADALPVLTYDGELTIHLNGGETRVFGVPPAHTDGDSYVWFPDADVLHAGDVFRTTGYPYIDRENGGTLYGTIEALGVAIGLAGPETRIIPGHGDVSGREDVIEFRDMVIDVRDRVRDLVDEGMTYEEVAAANPTAPYDGRWGDPERFLTAMYAELAAMD